MKRFQFLIWLFNFDYVINNDIYQIYPKKIIPTGKLHFKVGLFTKLLKFTSISPDYCAMFVSQEHSDIWTLTPVKSRFNVEVTTK